MVAASSQVLTDKQGYEEQRQHTQEAEAAKVTKTLGDGGRGEDGSCLVRDASLRRWIRWVGPF
jgi:hypothetical protein